MPNRFLGAGDEEAMPLLAGFGGRDDGTDTGGSARGAAGFVQPLLLELFASLTSSTRDGNLPVSPIDPDRNLD